MPSPTPIRLGRFDLHSILGQGGMGVVWEGIHRPNGTPVAVKVLRRDKDFGDELLTALEVEIRATAALDHPNIVPLLDAGTLPDSLSAEDQIHGRLIPGSPYLINELVTGGTLLEHVGKLSWTATEGVLHGLLDGLSHAHARGVIHRDLKPSNVLISRRPGPRLVPRLTDFGIARLLPTPSQLDDGEEGFRGSPTYVAPEQFAGLLQDIGPWTDLYSLGIVTWLLATGVPPYRSRSVPMLMEAHLAGDLPAFEPRSAVPEGLEVWLRQLIRRDPAARPPNAAEARRLLDRLCRPESDVGPPTMAPGWRLTEPPSGKTLHVGAGLGLYHLRRRPLVGRLRPRDRLWTALKDVVEQRHPRALFLEGPSGVGKSRLAEWICVRAQEQGLARVVRATHGPRLGPSHGLPAMLARLLRVAGMEFTLAEHRVIQRLRRLGEPNDYLAESVLTLLEAANASDRDTNTGTGSGPIQRNRTVATLLERLGQESPLILWVDDLQWGWELVVLTDLLVSEWGHSDLPVLILATVQSDGLKPDGLITRHLDELRLHPSVESLPLGPLSNDECEELTRDLIRIDDDLAAAVVRRSQGNPLFAVQLVNDWVDRELLEEEGEQLQLCPGAEVAIPDSLHALWTRRITRAIGEADEDQGAKALEIAAALGRDVSLDEWGAVCRVARLALPGGLLGSLALGGLVLPNHDGFSFAHSLAQESLARRAREGERWSDWHDACATVLHERDRFGNARRVASHQAEAGQFEAAVQSGLIAVRQLVETSDHDQALDLLHDRRGWLEAAGLGAGSRPWVQGAVWRAQVLRLCGREREAYEVAVEADKHARAGGWNKLRGWALRETGIHLRDEGNLQVAIRTLLEGRALFAALGPNEGLAAISESLATSYREAGQSERAAEISDEVIRIYRSLGIPHGLSASLLARATLLRRLGRLGEAVDLLDEALSIAKEYGYQRGLASAYQEVSNLWYARGESILALEALDTAQEYEDRVGTAHSRASMLINRGELMRSLSDLNGAATCYRGALQLMEAAGSQWTRLPRVNLAFVDIDRGRASDALPVLEEVEAELLEAGRGELLFIMRTALVLCFAQAKRWADFDAIANFLARYEEGQYYIDRDALRYLDLGADAAEVGGHPNRAAILREVRRKVHNVLVAHEETASSPAANTQVDG